MWTYSVQLLLLLITGFSKAVPIEDGCTITMPTDIPNPEPVYIVSSKKEPTPKLFTPQGQVTVLPLGSKLTLYCAGNGNTLSIVDQQILDLECQSGNVFYSKEKSKNFSLNQLSCSKIPSSDLLRTSRKCSNDRGYVFEAGFNFDSDFLTVFSICYDNNTETTLYSRNVINGATQNYKINESTRRSFRADGLKFSTTATNKFYTNKNQVSRFEGIFGKDQSYINKTSFFARGHLSPDADFIFGYEQLATYFYANCAPEFQVVNAGNWVRVESFARNLAKELKSDLLTFTSTLGVVKLPHSKTNEMIPIYLDPNEYINAPLYYYKILIHPELKSLVLITLNNPFANPEDVEEFCENVCDQFDLNASYFTDVTRGYTFCCTLEDFKNSVPNLPTFDYI